jgi:uncharacterized protein YecT (DUF1311 family)
MRAAIGKWVGPVLASWCLLSSGAAAQDVRCNPQGSTMELAACASNDYQRADRAMNAVYGKLVSRAQEMDRTLAPGDTDKAVDRLRKAQRAWVAWRSAECPLRSIQNKGGSIERIEWPACAARLTEDRVKVLESLQKDME